MRQERHHGRPRRRSSGLLGPRTAEALSIMSVAAGQGYSRLSAEVVKSPLSGSTRERGGEAMSVAGDLR